MAQLGERFGGSLLKKFFGIVPCHDARQGSNLAPAQGADALGRDLDTLESPEELDDFLRLAQLEAQFTFDVILETRELLGAPQFPGMNVREPFTERQPCLDNPGRRFSGLFPQHVVRCAVIEQVHGAPQGVKERSPLAETLYLRKPGSELFSA
jgi:hypothetical protein